MTDQEYCQKCGRRHNCQEIYGKLGRSDGSSVTLSVVIAFLAPIVVFIASLVVVERVVGGITEIVELRTAVGLFAAAAASFCWVLAARAINRQLNSNK